MTQPLTPANCDLRDFHRMMIDIPRLRASSFDAIADDTAWRAALNLWMSSWHGDPAASLDDDDATLCKAAGLGRDLKTWRKVRSAAMRGWERCDDGKWYHPTVAEFALEAWLEKLAQRLSSGAGNKKRWGVDFDPAQIERDIGIAAGLLTALNPASKSLPKLSRRLSRSHPNGTENRSRSHPEDIPSGSQETGEETGIYKKEANASSVVSAEPKPTEADRTEEQGLLAELELGPKPKQSPWLKDAAFCAAWKSCTLEMRKRSKDRDKTWPIWARAAVRAGGPDVLLAALQAYVAGDKDIGRTGGPGFHLWLSEGKWEHWLASQQASPGAPKAPWVGPADLRAAAVAQKDEGWAQAYIDPSGWRDLPKPALIPRNGFAAKIIREEIGHILRQMGVEIEEMAA